MAMRAGLLAAVVLAAVVLAAVVLAAVVLAAVVLADVASAAAGIWPVGDPAPVQGRRLLRGLSLLAQPVACPGGGLRA